MATAQARLLVHCSAMAQLDKCSPLHVGWPGVATFRCLRVRSEAPRHSRAGGNPGKRGWIPGLALLARNDESLLTLAPLFNASNHCSRTGMERLPSDLTATGQTEKHNRRSDIFGL